jgi:transcriptional regulator with XRE-family HTH domain
MRRRRTGLAMTQEQLAREIGMTRQQVQLYERGVIRVSGNRLAAIAKALQVPASFEHSAEDMEAVQGSLLNTRGAVSLLRAYAAIKDQRQRQAMVNIARAMAGEEPLGDEDAVH